MASAAPTTGAPLRAPGKLADYSAPAPSRRAMLGLAAGATVIALPFGSSAAAPRVTRWHVLRAQYEAARDEAERFYQAKYKPAFERIKKVVGPCPPMICTIAMKNGGVIHVRITGDGDHPPFPAWDKAREMDRQYAAWRDRNVKAEANPTWAAIQQMSERLDQAEDDARIAMMAEPAPDLAAMTYKLRLALSNDELWENERAALAADAARFA